MFAKFFAESLDIAVIWSLTRFFLSRSHHHTEPSELEQLLHLYQSADPDHVFSDPCPTDEFAIQSAHHLFGHSTEEFVFPSAVQTPIERNNTVHARRIRSGSLEGKPVLILVPGWIIGHLDPLLWYFGRPLLRMGISSVVIEPPYQMRRTPSGSWTGEYTISGNMVRTFDSIRQAVLDVRRLIAILRQQGASRIGVMGMSMGGWITSLVSVVETDLALSAIVVPPVDLTHILKTSPLLRTIRNDIIQDGLLDQDVSRVSFLLSPLSYPLRVPLDRVRLFQARHDRALPPKGVEDLWNHWGRPLLRKYSAGHISIVLSPGFLRDFRRDCRQLLLDGVPGDSRRTS